MKKIISTVVLGAILATGLFFTQSTPQVDVAVYEKEPSIFSISSSSVLL